MRPSCCVRCRGDEGAAVVEAALVLPVLFTLVLALFDFGLFELKQSAVSSGARDGARTGVVNWDHANVGTYTGGACPTVSASNSATFVAICTAVRRRLAHETITGISVRCLNGTTLLPISTTAWSQCDPANASITRGSDLLEVTVTYPYTPSSLVVQKMLPKTVYTRSSRMVLL